TSPASSPTACRWPTSTKPSNSSAPARAARSSSGRTEPTMPDALQYLADELSQLKAESRFHLPRVLSGPQGPVAEFDGRRVVNLSSNNYLGLANDERLKEAALRATR